MTMSAEEHWHAWLDKWGDAYATDEERRAAYKDHQDELARISAIAEQFRAEQQG